MTTLTACALLALAAAPTGAIVRTLRAEPSPTAGRHRPDTVDPVAPDWRPWTAAQRLALRMDTMPLPVVGDGVSASPWTVQPEWTHVDEWTGGLT